MEDELKMVRLRLRRGGKKKSPHYRIIAADSRYPRDGRFIEIIGFYCPVSNPKKIDINIKKALTWLKNGAQPSETVRGLFKQKGILKMWHDIRNGAALEDVLPKEEPAGDPMPEYDIKAIKKTIAREAVSKEVEETVTPPADDNTDSNE